MDNIVMDSGAIFGSVEHMRLLRCLAQERDFNFREDNYKWVLGIKVFSEVAYKTIFRAAEFDTRKQLFGIDVEIDYRRPEVVELWKNITNDL